MLFKYPQLLWSLWLLLIPILIHLLQLRKFKKTPFTNVRFLQKVVAESQKSQKLKRWLLLITRLGLFACLILAFSQPFFADDSAFIEKETTIYLDNSFSLQARNENTTLLEQAVQDLIKSVPNQTTFNLFTNNKEYFNVTIEDIQNDLLQIPFTSEQLTLSEINIKAATSYSKNPNTEKRLLVISDFQKRIASDTENTTDLISVYYLPVRTGTIENIAIDSAYIDASNPLSLELVVLLSSATVTENIPVSLYNGETLIAKSAAEFNSDRNAQLIFTLPSKELIDGKVTIPDTGLIYDNQLYFNLNTRDKIKVLNIGSPNNTFLRKIYSDDEFVFQYSEESDLNLSVIANNDLIVLNEVPVLSPSLQSALRSYLTDGGSLVIIPSDDMQIASYNRLLSTIGFSYLQKNNAEREILHISFSHPLFKNVFEKEIQNFQYPKVASYYGVSTQAPAILSYDNNDPFLSGSSTTYLFTAPINEENSNFKSSPLIVPTFYSMAINSLKLPDLYYNLGTTISIDIPEAKSQDEVIKLGLGTYEFIPQQQIMGRKTRLHFKEQPGMDGIFTILNVDSTRKITFNYNRKESHLEYLNVDVLSEDITTTSISDIFESFEKDSAVTALWKWFVILALILMLTEIIIQKVFK